MLSRFNSLTLIFAIVFAAGCAPSTVNYHKAPDANYASYDVVVVPDFRMSDLEWLPLDSGEEIANMIAEELQKSNNFKVISRTESQNGYYDGRTLLVNGTVTGYTRGCKYCEMAYRGFKDKGKGSIQVWVTLVDQTTGETISDVGVDGRAKPPGHGRSKYIRVVEEIVNIIDIVNNSNT